jgi:hypothetical protein
MITMNTRRTVVSLAVIALVATGLVHAQIKSSWKAPDVGPMDFKGKKVAAVVITDDLSIQTSGEEALARMLVGRGVTGVASYRMIPKEELRDPTKAKGWFQRGNVAGVVVMRVLSSEKETVYTPTVWATATYSSFWNYYGTSWTSVRSYKTSQATTVTIETLVYDVVNDKLVWAGVSQTKNPKNIQILVNELVNDVAAEMRTQGLITGGR